MFACGIRNPGLWNPEYSSRNPDPTNDCYSESKLQDIDSNPVPGIRNPRRGIQNSRPSRVSLHRGSSVNKYEGLFRNTGHLRWPDTSLLHTPRVAPCRSLISLTLYKVGTSLRLTLIAGPSGEENCPPTPPLSQHFALREKHVLILA